MDNGKVRFYELKENICQKYPKKHFPSKYYTMAQITRYLVKFRKKQINQSDGSNIKIEPFNWLIRFFPNFTRYQVI